MDGILNLAKPAGWTSHDAVAFVRRLIQQRRVGHAGTLDPIATGVLLICIGQATRVADYLMTSPKTYCATLVLGVTTDTYDSTGQVIDSRPVITDENGIRATLQQFIGDIEQVPPMYAALKHQGQPLYKLARRGITLERPARKVHIHSIILEQVQLPKVVIRVRCSSGVYIRSLAHDIGQALGCGAHMTALAREASGTFTLSAAIAPAAFEAAVAENRWSELLYPLDAALQAWPATTLDEAATQRVRQGQAVRLNLPPPASAEAAPRLCRAYDAQGRLVAVMVYRADSNVWRPDKVFDLSPST